jgi:hypothetical protein
MQCKFFLSILETFIFCFVVSSELMQQRQRVGDLEEEVGLLQKQLRSTQKKVIDQVEHKLIYLKTKIQNVFL